MADTLESLEIEIKHNASGAADEIKNITSAVRSLGRALDKVIPSLQTFQATLSGEKMPTVNNNYISQTADTINNVQKTARGAKSATSDAAKGIDKMSNAAGNSAGKLGKFISSLKRIAMYRLLRTIIKEITQAFQEGMQWAYQFSAGIDGDGNRFASAMDRIKTASSQMKAQLGAAFISLLTALEPVITAIINLITKLADGISQLISAFTGTTYLKAAEVPQQWADAAGSAGRAAKEWKNQLMGFDEINRLEEPSKGGGGGSAGVDPSQMFEASPIEEWAMKVHDWWDKLTQKIRNSGIVEAFQKVVASLKKFGDSELWDIITDCLGLFLDGGLTWLLDVARDSLNIIADIFNGDLNQGVKDFKDLLVDFTLDPLIMLADIFDRIFGTHVGDWFRELKEGLKLFDPTTLPGFEKLEEAFSKLGAAWEKLKKSVGELADAFGIMLEKTGAADELKTILEEIFKIGFDMLLEAAAVALTAIADALTFIADLLSGNLGAALDDFKDFWTDFGLGCLETIAQLIDDIFKTDLVGWVSDLHQKVEEFSLADWLGIQKTADGMQKLLTETIPKWVEDFKQFWHSITLDPFHIPAPHFEWTYTEASGLIAKALEFVGLPATIPHLNISWYAQGGFPQEGDLFFANERGAEMVGSMNGRTAVANNDQIVEGIRQGVFEAVSAAMNGGGQDVNVKVFLDSHQIKAGQQRLSRAMGV